MLVSEWTDFLVRERWALVSRYFTPVETGDAEVAVVYFDDKVTRVVGPGQRVLFWKGPVEVTYDLINARENAQVPAILVPAILRLGRESQATAAVVDEGKRGLLYLDGRLVRDLAPGTYAFWNAAGFPRVDVLELRLQTLEVPGQEILTRDKVTVRVNICGDVSDRRSGRGPRKCKGRVRSPVSNAADRRAADAWTPYAGGTAGGQGAGMTHPLSAEVRAEMEVYGVRVGEIALKDIILPGDIRDILNQVVTAEKQAQANLIRRREETAATRSLLNTAKLMEDNPLLVRLKELETLERVAEKVEKITVVDGLNGLLDGAVKLSR